MTTQDKIAVELMLSSKKIPKALLREVAVASGSECPECGSRHTESNGSAEYRCCECDHRWGFEYGERQGF